MLRTKTRPKCVTIAAAFLLFINPLHTQQNSWELKEYYDPARSQTMFWQSMGLDTSHVLSIGIDSGGYIFAGTTRYRSPTTGTYYGGDLFRTNDAGESWFKVAPDSITSGPINVITITPEDKIFFGGGGGRGVFRSTDHGEHWTLVGFRDHYPQHYQIESIIFIPPNEIWVAESRTCGWQCGTFGEIFSTQDEGDHWARIWFESYNVPEDLVFDSRARIFLAVTHLYLFGGAYRSYVYRSLDSGKHWTLLLNNITDTFVNSFAVNPTDHIFASTFQNGVFRSLDNGETWTQINTGLTNTQVRCLAINTLGYIFAGTNGGGVFLSKDDGETWTAINAGLTNLNINTLVHDASGYVYAGSERGIFRSIQSTTSVKSTTQEMPASFSLKQNYPNPFNPATTIEYEVAHYAFVSIKLYDILGREVRRLVNGEHKPGIYRLHFDGSGLSSGLYYYTMQAGSFTETKQMILAK